MEEEGGEGDADEEEGESVEEHVGDSFCGF